MTTPPEIAALLAGIRSVAVVGWSTKADRPSHWIADYLEQDAGLRVFRVNPAGDPAGTPPVWPSLEALPETVDVVDVFRSPPHVPEVVEAAVRHGARVVWMQPGAENEEAAATARAAGLEAVVGQCLYARHKAWQAEQGD
jgi:predicted CoA-binding protein